MLPSGVCFPEYNWHHVLLHTRKYRGCHHTNFHLRTHTHTQIYEHTHSLAPPVSLFRLIWCSRLCSKHSWSARVNRSCRTWEGRRHARGTGGCLRRPPHDSPAGTPAQSHPPGAFLPPSLLSPPHWEFHLWTQEQCMKFWRGLLLILSFLCNVILKYYYNTIKL